MLDLFQAGNCFKCDPQHRCLKFGFHSFESYKRLANNGWITDSDPINAYLMTDARPPYCRKWEKSES